MEQNILFNYEELDQWFQKNGCRVVLLVCGSSIRYMELFNQHLQKIEKTGVRIIRFSDFQPNPQYESVVKGVALFRQNCCDSLIAVGGGSAIDVAKCIKAYTKMEGNGEAGSFLNNEIVANTIPFLVMPTTAGTGSEATRYAVIYFEGKKQSVTSESFIPGTVLMDPDALKTLPVYQRKSTMMDAFCHAIESFWSVNSTDESKTYSREAIRGILSCMNGYLQNTEAGNVGMLKAAYIAGKAINITQTTAGHAMCYRITSLFGCAHGHAAILCDRVLYPWMTENTDKCIDPRGQAYLKKTLDEIGQAMGCKNAEDGADKLQELFDFLELKIPEATEEQYEELRKSVNSVRLKNHPTEFDEKITDMIYHKILR